MIEPKLSVALAERRKPDTFIVGPHRLRSALLGLDEALRRAERFARLGVDGVFIAGLKTMADYERVGRELQGVRLSAAMFEGCGHAVACARRARRARLHAGVVSRLR